VAELAENASLFDEKNARLAVIGTGRPEHFKSFRQITHYDGDLYTDPERKVFSLLGFPDGLTGVVGLGAGLKAVSAFKQGFRQGSIQGHTFQLGGAIIIDPSDTILFFFAGKKAGDHPRIDALLGALDHS
jgi:hypothetical protein